MILEKKQIIFEQLKKMDTDSYLLLGRESSISQDPVCELLGLHFIGLTGVLFFGQKVYAFVNSNDFQGFKQLKIFDEVFLYKNLEESLQDFLEENKIKSIALNFSENDPSADGLSHGLFMKLKNILEKIKFSVDMVSAYEIVLKIRGIKSSYELKAIKESALESLEIFEEISRELKIGHNVEHIFNSFQEKTKSRGHKFAWVENQCPGVMLGPESPLGHLGITDIVSKENYCMTVDFGVKKNKFASDIQRVYFFGNGDEVPEELKKAFETCKTAIRLAADFIKEGVTGYQVDKVARDYIKNSGYPEWNYALGHQVGREAHDGGTILAPDRDRYNRKELIHTPLDLGNVFTLELGVPTSHGYVGLEEMIVVGKEKGEFLVPPQEKIFMIKESI